MKKLLVYVLCVYFLCACSDSAKEQDKSESAKLVESYPQIVALLEKESAGDTQGEQSMRDALQKAGVSNEQIEEIGSLITRAKLSGYELILPNDLAAKSDEFIIISTLPRGIYNLGLIPHAKHFEFALSPSLNDDGSEWNWEADGLSRAQKEFIELLGDNKDAKIVFYDSGEHIFAPVGSAHLGIMWAKHLGYTQLYRLVGGFDMWKELKLPITTEVPHCCEM
ncbi:rhodanese-like domain-containing protein [uncultured Helicobacter sp.]|uniref:rhodanese-like domain-containing protein n=1 Tax=uncultured Helicobacter sp. TaxID=175537 RepID=UPI002608888C|nr:rhodanese-like domain-containing protein [uncultured Helicobacter sp.]